MTNEVTTTEAADVDPDAATAYRRRFANRAQGVLNWAYSTAKLALAAGTTATSSWRWNNDRWVTADECGTTMCFAGKAAVDAGYQLHVDAYDNHAYVADARGEPGQPIATIAVVHLGLSDEDDRLFDAGLLLSDLYERCVELYGDDAIVVPDDVVDVAVRYAELVKASDRG
jgi:hypothetical protein